MKNIIIAILLFTAALFADCKVLATDTVSVAKGDTTVIDTTVVVQNGKSVLACVNPDQLRDMLDRDDSLTVDLDTALRLIDLYEVRMTKTDSIDNLMLSMDSLTLRQIDTLKNVISLSDSTEAAYIKIREIDKKKVERCEKSKMTLGQKALTAVGLMLIGFLAGLSI